MLCACFVLLLLAVPGWADTLASIPEAKASEELCSVIETTSGDGGRWCSREYYFPDGKALQVELMTGPAVGEWAPASGLVGAEGPLGSGALSRTVSVGGSPALLEWSPLLGATLAVSLKPNGTLTLESRRIDSLDLLPLAERLLAGLQEATGK